jgi:hypothetical protein
MVWPASRKYMSRVELFDGKKGFKSTRTHQRLKSVVNRHPCLSAYPGTVP